MTALKATRPFGGFGIYIHWPFCLAKCPYCDFNSHVREAIDQARWADALITDLRFQLARAPHVPAQSIFFGGGTPSLMAASIAERVIDEIARGPGVTDDVEITLEANPTSVEAATFGDFKAAGVNRFSLGIQALNDQDLAFLGRKHSADEALRALERAQAQDVRVSADLIYARPGQSLDDWQAELTRALGFGTDHLSLYQLTLEPGTAFTRAAERGELTLPDEDLAADLFELTQTLTGHAGLDAYEVSNHARPGAEAAHNLVYWRGGEYLGVGPGAHGRISIDGQRHATIARRTPEDWLTAVARDGHGLMEQRALSHGDQAEEYVLMGLRLAEGIDHTRYQALAGRTLDLAALIDDGLIIQAGQQIKASPRGRLVLNALIAALL
jgi:oxygen-independent coproporphyrinogen-3 oxidase